MRCDLLHILCGSKLGLVYGFRNVRCGGYKGESNFGEPVNVTVTEMPAVSLMLAAEGESTEAEEETEQPTEWTLEPDKGYYVTLQWPGDENAQTEGYCVITIGSSQYRTEVFSNTLSFICYTTGMEYPVVMKIDGFSGEYEATYDGEIILDGDTIGEEPAPTPAPEATVSPEPTSTPDATVFPEPTPTPETTASPEPTPTEDPTPTAAPTTESAEGQEQSAEQASAPASQG